MKTCRSTHAGHSKIERTGMCRSMCLLDCHVGQVHKSLSSHHSSKSSWRCVQKIRGRAGLTSEDFVPNLEHTTTWHINVFAAAVCRGSSRSGGGFPTFLNKRPFDQPLPVWPAHSENKLVRRRAGREREGAPQNRHWSRDPQVALLLTCVCRGDHRHFSSVVRETAPGQSRCLCVERPPR